MSEKPPFSLKVTPVRSPTAPPKQYQKCGFFSLPICGQSTTTCLDFFDRNIVTIDRIIG